MRLFANRLEKLTRTTPQRLMATSAKGEYNAQTRDHRRANNRLILSGESVMRSRRLFPVLALLVFAAGVEAAPPRVADDRLVLELVATEPDIVTPTGLTVDEQGRVWVIENNTHQRPSNYKGPTATASAFSAIPVPTAGSQGHDLRRRLQERHEHRPGPRRRSSTWPRAPTSCLARHQGHGTGRRTQVIVQLETTGDYPHNGLSGFAFDGAATCTSAGREPRRRLQADRQRRHHAAGRRRRRQHLSLPARRHQARADRHRLLEPVPHDASTPSAGCSPSTTIPTLAVRAGCCTSSPAAITATASATAARDCIRSPPGTANCPARCRWSPAPARRRAASWRTSRTACPTNIAASCWSPRGAITSSSDSRSSRAGPRSRRKLGRWCAAATTFGRSASRTAPDGSLYLSDWVDKSYPVHGKGRHLAHPHEGAAGR